MIRMKTWAKGNFTQNCAVLLPFQKLATSTLKKEMFFTLYPPSHYSWAPNLPNKVHHSLGGLEQCIGLKHGTVGKLRFRLYPLGRSFWGIKGWPSQEVFVEKHLQDDHRKRPVNNIQPVLKTSNIRCAYTSLKADVTFFCLDPPYESCTTLHFVFQEQPPSMK